MVKRTKQEIGSGMLRYVQVRRINLLRLILSYMPTYPNERIQLGLENCKDTVSCQDVHYTK